MSINSKEIKDKLSVVARDIEVIAGNFHDDRADFYGEAGRAVREAIAQMLEKDEGMKCGNS